MEGTERAIALSPALVFVAVVLVIFLHLSVWQGAVRQAIKS